MEESIWVVGKEIQTVDGAKKMCWRRDTIKGEGTQLEKIHNTRSKKQQETKKKE